MKVIVTSKEVITPSKEFIGKEHELAAKLDIQEYQIIDAVDAPDLRSEEDKIIQQILDLEVEITPRRLREAVLGDDSWLAAKEAEITALREQLA